MAKQTGTCHAGEDPSTNDEDNKHCPTTNPQYLCWSLPQRDNQASQSLLQSNTSAHYIESYRFLTNMASFEYLLPSSIPAQKPSKLTPQTFFVFLGLMNNLPFNLILNSVQNQVPTALKLNLIQYIAIGILSVILVIIHIYCLLGVAEKNIIYGVVACNCLGFIAYGIMVLLGHETRSSNPAAITVIVVISGGIRYFGQTVIISYIGNHDSQWITGWSLGTGLTSLIGVGLFRLSKISDVAEWVIIGISIWLQIIVGCSFFYIDRNQPFKTSASSRGSEAPQQLQSAAQSTQLSSYCSSEVFKKSWVYLLNSLLVYFLTYSILLVFTSPHQKAPLLAYVMYEIGTCLSRSSLFFIVITKWPYLNIIQGINFVLWFVLSFYSIARWVELVWMVVVGSVGGTVYVNLFFQLLQQKDLDPRERRIVINLVLIGAIMGAEMSVGLSGILYDVLPNSQPIGP